MKKILVISNYVPKPGFNYSGGLKACKHRDVSHGRLQGLERYFPESFCRAGVEWEFLLIERYNAENLWEKLQSDFDLLIISGSPFCCGERPFWMDNLRLGLQKFIKEFPDRKILSICFGAQILAEVMGGEVALCEQSQFFDGEGELVLDADFDFEEDLHMRIYHENYIKVVPENVKLLGTSVCGMAYFMEFSVNSFAFQPHIECGLRCDQAQEKLDRFLVKFFRKFLGDL